MIRRYLRLFGFRDNQDPSNQSQDSSSSINNINMNESSSCFTPSPSNVLDVKSILWQKKFPVELIDSIIDFAEYWPRFVTEVVNTVAVRNNHKCLYLQTQPLPGLFTQVGGEVEDAEQFAVGGVEARTLNPARKVVFRIWSNDQGWSSNPGRGTYTGSHSWFELFPERPLSVAAIRDAVPFPNPIDITDDSKLEELQSPNEQQSWRTLTIATTVQGEDGLEDVVSEKNMWHLQRNLHAKRSPTQHEIAWSWTDDDRGEETGENLDKTGAGRGGDLVRGLRSGDRLSVVARAMYPGWENNVQRMQVEVFYAV